MDRINANVFREMKNAKHGRKVNDIYAPKKKSPDKKKFTKPTGKYELFDDVPGAGSGFPGANMNALSKPGYKPPGHYKNISAGNCQSLVPKNNNDNLNYINENDNMDDLYYADPNNYKKDLTTNTIVKNGIITRTNGTGITTIQAIVNNPNKPNQPEAWQYKIRTKKAEEPNFNTQDLELKKSKMTAQEKQLAKMTGRVLVNTVKTNRMTKGTQGMMDNERLHAQEAIESRIYVNWSIRSYAGNGPNSVDCFRIGSNSMCICGHGFPMHDKILNKNKFSSKCNKCKCKAFKYIPVYPEEVGEYWIPFQKNFSYETYRCKCKCKHTWNEHDGAGFLNCKKCGCGSFTSAFCCAVCNKFWQDHEVIYETEDERRMAGKPVREDFIPFNEMPEMYDALYK